MSFHNRLAEAALRDGNTPQHFRGAAQRHANAFWFFAAVAAAVWYFAGWGWSLIPFSLAGLTALQSVSSTLTAWKLEQLMPYAGTASVAAALPPQIDLDDVSHVTILDDVRQKYSALLADQSHPYAGCMYQPASLLPYPKATIRRALEALLDFVECRRDSTFLESSLRTPEIAETLRTSLVFLDHFLEIPQRTFPLIHGRTRWSARVCLGSEWSRPNKASQRPGAEHQCAAPPYWLEDGAAAWFPRGARR